VIKLAFAFFAKAGELNPDGQFHVLGAGFDRVTVHQLPGLIPQLSLVLKLLLSEEECGREHRLSLKIRAPHEITLPTPVDFPFAVAKNRFPGLSPVLDKFVTIINFFSFEITKEDLYDFIVVVDDTPIGSVSLSCGLEPDKRAST
jgi:hypothetical protein